MKHKKIYLFGIIAFLLLMIVSFLSTSNSPKEYPDFVTESPSPTGTKALYTYLQEANKKVQTQSIHPSEMRARDAKEVRILINPSIYTNQQVIDSYTDYIMDGNTIILWKYNPDGLFDLKADYVDISDDTTEEIQTNNLSFDAQIESAVRLDALESDQVLLEDELGVIGLERQIGAGKLITILEPGWLTNEVITKEDHTALVFYILSLVDSTSFIFDEYGRSAGGQITSHLSLYPNWAYILLVEGILFAILILWYQGKRFGPIIPVREENIRFSDERIKALAIWYLKGKNYHASLVDQANFLKEVIRERFGIPYSKNWRERLEALEQKIDIPADELKILARELEEILQQDNVHKQEYIQWSKSINNIRKEVEKG
ncbi:DUF4350 domain-containing protein [Gracilibacillus xinjiangensis]|uniref:DUF4350 domain-containing protein n=1 Tax=Gracilibacillus xinjiangensis TaxID=1193282 RepID=A0ABV8WRP5_9BACI